MLGAIHKRLGLAESGVFPDPFGLGLEIEVRRYNNADYQGFLRDQQTKSPTQRAMFEAGIKAGLQHQANQLRCGKKESAEINELELHAVALERVASELDLTEDKIATIMGAPVAEGIATHLMRVVTELPNPETGDPSPYTPEIGIQLLTDLAVVPAAAADGSEINYGVGRPFGEALQEWVIERSRELEKGLQLQKDRAGKALPPSSGGATESGAN